MNPAVSALDTLVHFLKFCSIPYDLQDQKLRIRGSLILVEAQGLPWLDITRLPENVSVLGDMEIRNPNFKELPDHLFVSRNLVLGHSGVHSLPASLRVGESIDLGGSPVRTLPAGLRVPGTLDLRRTDIRTLPEGLSVGAYLNLCGTRVKHLPRDLKVGGPIHPPSTLRDIRVFLRTQPRRVVLKGPESQHRRLQVMAQLRHVPDLARVVLSLKPGSSLHLQQKFLGPPVAQVIPA